MFFQIYKGGQAVDGGSYSTLEKASSALERAQQGGQVAEVDASDKIVRRYTLQECRAAIKGRHAPVSYAAFKLLLHFAHRACFCYERLAPATSRPKTRLALRSYSASSPARLVFL